MITEEERKEIMEKAEQLFAFLEKRFNAEEMKKVREGFQFAFDAHINQRRKSGIPYINHPLAVATIVAQEMQLGYEAVIAAFNHDVVEDTEHTLDDIDERFGHEVAFIVNVVTKKKLKSYKMTKQVDNYKQLLDSLQRSELPLLVKIADRLHNMRTLDSMRPDKQMKIAGETDYFYAPLANRLGYYWTKTELENLSFRFRCPREYATMQKWLAKDREENQKNIEGFVEDIRNILKRNNIEARIEVKYRMPYSVWRKMHRESKDFKHVDNRHYIKIIFPYVNGMGMNEKDMCLQIYSYLTDKLKEKPGSVINYIDNPKENGYQSFHVKLLSQKCGKWEEVHICSERMVQDSRLGCMATSTTGNIQRWIDKFKASLRDIAMHGMLDGYIEDVVKSFYNDDIMVLTKDGDAVMLPKRATALDFAFSIHSEVGLHAKVAYINNNLCSVKTELKRGDCVRIVTDNNVKPKDDWMSHVLTYKAKRDITTYLNNRPTHKYCRCPQCNPIPCDEIIGFMGKDGKVSIHKRNCPTLIRLASQYGDNIVPVVFRGEPYISYPVAIHIKAIDSQGLLQTLITRISSELGLFINGLEVKSEDYVVDCTISFNVHSANELDRIIQAVGEAKGVEEVTQC